MTCSHPTVERPRPWGFGEPFWIADCVTCKSTISIPEPDHWVSLDSLLSGTIERNRRERLTLKPAVSDVAHLQGLVVR